LLYRNLPLTCPLRLAMGLRQGNSKKANVILRPSAFAGRRRLPGAADGPRVAHQRRRHAGPAGRGVQRAAVRRHPGRPVARTGGRLPPEPPSSRLCKTVQGFTLVSKILQLSTMTNSQVNSNKKNQLFWEGFETRLINAKDWLGLGF
jgi:hypothetical protein